MYAPAKGRFLFSGGMQMKRAQRISVLFLAFMIMLESFALAAGARLSGIRFHSGRQHDRVVFDLSALPKYEARLSGDGRELTVDLSEVTASGIARANFHGQRIQSVKYKLENGHVLVTLALKEGMSYQVQTLKNPHRLLVDIVPGKAKTAGSTVSPIRVKPAQKTGVPGLEKAEVAPGLISIKYSYHDEDGKVTAYFVEADNSKYIVKPALAKGKVPGRETVSGISDRYQALAAVNASYFALNGDILGVTKVDGMTAGTTYITRSAFGTTAQGKPVFGKIDYDGRVKLGGISQGVSGVDCERGENTLIIYNPAYGYSTRTNEYGMEYVVRNGKVTAIHEGGNAPIPKDGCVISVHGTAASYFAPVRVGDPAVITEDMGDQWNNCPNILGVGPRLLTDGKVTVTVAEEEFPGDIRYGRAPRSAVGVTKDGHFLLGVVDGRQAVSHGLTLTEWAYLMKKMGAVDAINFDGGGSSELVVGGQIQNSPSDGNERPVGSALIVLNK